MVSIVLDHYTFFGGGHVIKKEMDMSSKHGLYDDEAGGQYIKLNNLRIFSKCKLHDKLNG